MIVYFIVIVIILLLRYNLDPHRIGNPDYATENRYLKVVCGIMVFLAGVRASTVGADTISYMADYAADSALPLAQVIYNHGSLGAGYFFFMKLFSLTGLSVHWWFAVVDLFYVFAVYRFIQEYSNDKLVSILCFFTIGLYSFSLAGLKQTTSMGFAILAFLALKNKKYLSAVISAILSYWCHSAVAIFAFGLVCYYLRNWKYYYLILSFFFIAVLLWGDSLWSASIDLLNDDHYTELYAEADNIYSSTTYIFYLLLLLIMIFPWRNYSKVNTEESRILYGMTLIATAFQSLATSFSTAFRVAYYFLPFMIVLIPNCCNYLKSNENKRLWKIGLCLICIFWCLYTGRANRFAFFWNE